MSHLGVPFTVNVERDRVLALGGHLRIDSPHGTATPIDVDLPLSTPGSRRGRARDGTAAGFAP